jgi:hypothetical protein
MRVSPSAISEIDRALKEYCHVVLASELSATSQDVYIYHADNFVRWLKGEFDPGVRVNPHPLKGHRPTAA